MALIKPLLGPTGTEFELADGVAKAEYWFEEVKVTHELDDGSSKFYTKGFKFHGRLVFNGMPQAQYDGLKTEYDRRTELNFVPNPQDYPATNFEVRWVNPFNLIYAYVSRTDRFVGTIELEGTEIFLNMPVWI